MRKLLSIILVIYICMITVISYAIDDNTNTGSNTENETTANETTVNDTTVNDTTVNDTTSNTTSSTVTVEGLEKLQDKKDEIQNQVEDAEQELETINAELTQNLQQILKIDTSIEETQTTLNSLNEEITNTQNEINTIQKELDELTLEYNNKKDLLDQRLVAVYKAGETQYLDVLLSSANLSDFISTYFLIQQLIDNDVRLLDIVQEEKEEIETTNLLLANKKEDLLQQKQVQVKTQKVLENAKTLRNNTILKLSAEEQEIQSKIDEYNNQISDIENEISSLAKTASFGTDYVGGTMQWPILNHNKLTSYYGMRTHPITGVYKLHTGIDISATTGTDFRASAYGIVTKAEMNTAYGNMVIIDHGGGVQTLYAHGSSIEVEVGQVVNAGDVVLKVGSTGYSTGPHAHFEIRINGNTVDPLDYIAIPED